MDERNRRETDYPALSSFKRPIRYQVGEETMRKLFLTIAGALALFVGSANLIASEAQAQPRHEHGYRPAPQRHYAPPRKVHRPPAYRPRCFTERVRVWNGFRHVTKSRRVCR
ncbi:hypothetical protein WJT86_04865 [Microvirga sp. W0021]|uniref:Uncharacterized protein n=1 Tax=Hohaiivirga grylli TaxID=3133970 RepID=A0ABV0BHE3_9HYPH